MASYRLNASIVKGQGGGSVLLKAAYRAAEKLVNERTGDTYDYSRKRGVAHTEIMLPDGSDPALYDRQHLWNTIEAYEFGVRKDAQLAREVTISLPHEMTDEERLALTREFVQEQFVDRGMAADVAIHTPQKDKGDDERNHHAHILLTLRSVSSEGIHPVKTRAWNSSEMLKHWREAFAVLQNRHLALGGYDDRVDHRTLAAQRDEARKQGNKELAQLLDRQPEIHVGPEARQISKKGASVRSQERYLDVYGKDKKHRSVRTVRYPAFDQGSRAAYNGTIIKRNANRAIDTARNREGREARLRRFKRYYVKQSRYLNDLLGNVARERRNKKEKEALLRMLQRRKAHYDARLSALESLIDHVLRLMLLTRSYEDRLLSRQQRYQLKYMLQERKRRMATDHGQRRSR